MPKRRPPTMTIYIRDSAIKVRVTGTTDDGNIIARDVKSGTRIVLTQKQVKESRIHA